MKQLNLKTTWKTGLVGLLSAALLGIGLAGCSDKKPAVDYTALNAAKAEIMENSPYASEIEVKLKARLETPWYHGHLFAALDEERIVMQDEGFIKGLGLAQREIEDSYEELMPLPSISEAHLYSTAGNIYWIDTSGKVHELKPEDSEYTHSVLGDLKDFFSRVPEHIGVGLIDEDDRADIMYQWSMKIGAQSHLVILARYGLPEGGFSEPVPIAYLGETGMLEFVVGDFDADGDTDMAKIMPDNLEYLTAIENETTELDSNPFAEHVERYHSNNGSLAPNFWLDSSY